MEAILERIGLTKNEAKVYLALLELGSTPAGALIKRVGMHRAAVYDIIDLLVDKGIVSYVVKANRKYFEAQDPDRLLEYLDLKKQELAKKEDELKKIIPQLQLKRKLSKEEQEGTIYKGKKGLKSIFEDILKENKTWYVLGGTGGFKDLFPVYYVHYQKKRARQGIILKIIFNEIIRKHKREKELKRCKIRYLPESHITPATVFIYGDKTAVILWGAEPMGFLMRSKQVADSYRQFFDLLWKSARP